MKTKILLLLVLSFCIGFSSFAQKGKEKKENPDHKNFYKDIKLETDDYTLEISDAVAQMEYSKMKVKITNKTNDFLIFNGSDCVFKFEFGEYSPNEKAITIKPNSSDTKVLNVVGETRFHVESFTFLLNGIVKVPADGKPYSAPDFQLPASVNDFTAGPFSVNLVKLKKETDETVAQFRAVYKGDLVGIIDPGKLGLRLENKQEFANGKAEYKTKLMEKGDEDKFNAYFYVPAKVTDMQFAAMWIAWRNTFTESKKIPVKGLLVDMQFDIGKTAAMNK